MAPSTRRVLAVATTVGLLPSFGALLLHCAEPTALVVEVFSEVPCAPGADVALFNDGDGAPMSFATQCSPAEGGMVRRGEVVIVPSGDKSAPVTFSIRGNAGATPLDPACTGADRSSCIEARRSLRFLTRTTSRLRVDLRLSCAGVRCSATQTCVKGSCVDAELDPAKCGSGCAEDSLPPPRTFTARTLACGATHSCLIESGAVSCWGANNEGQLGDGTAAARATRVKVKGITNASQIDTESRGLTTCARLADGSVRCWGANDWGNVGTGKAGGFETTPVTAIPSGIVQVAVGHYHTCARTFASKVSCWGDTDNGQMVAPPSGPFQLAPVAIEPLPTADLFDVRAGAHFTFALYQDGTLYGWGADAVDVLLDTPSGTTRTPRQSAIAPLSTIEAGAEHACAIDKTGAVQCWGSNLSGETGLPSSASTPPHVIAALTDVVEVAVGEFFSCARRRDGAVSCWGKGSSGQLGNGATATSSAPVSVKGISTATAICTGLTHACALLASGEVRCWGSNGSGQLGDGTKTQRSEPVVVLP